jgi:hypothetical protein
MSEKLTLDSIRKAPELAPVRASRASDWLDKEDVAKLREIQLKRHKKAKFDEVDSLVAEIISRFGYEVYLKWNSGEITTEEITHYINAERAREAARMAEIESVIVGAIGSIFSKSKTTARKINEIIKLNQKIAKGES